MHSKINIPKEYTAFLYWVKERTEAYWSKDPNAVTDENEILCEEWIRNAKWMGLSEEEIDEIEENYQITFTPQHRGFLRILHAIDRKEIIEEKPFEEGGKVEHKAYPFFYNWKTDDKEIKYYFDWPYTTMLEDVFGANQVWLESWGKIRPKSDKSREEIFGEWFKTLPKLLPIKGHRFVVGDPIDEMSPVCSMYGTDIVVYGWNMRHYLLQELYMHLDLMEYVYDEEDEEYYPETIEELNRETQLEWKMAKGKEIPVLEEMILFWSSGWSSYGKKYPNLNNETLCPIVKTFMAQDEDEEGTPCSNQKRFSSL